MEQEIQKIDLAKYSSVVRRRLGWGILTASVMLACTILAAASMPQRYTADCVLQIRGEADELLGPARRPGQYERTASIVDRLQEIMLSYPAVNAVITQAGLDADLENREDEVGRSQIRETLKKDITVMAIGERLVKVVYVGPSPDKAYAVVDGLVSKLRERVLRERNDSYHRALEHRQQEAQNLANELADADRRHREYLEQHPNELPETKDMKLRGASQLEFRLNDLERLIKSASEKVKFWDEALRNLDELVVKDRPNWVVREHKERIRMKLEEELADVRVALLSLRQRYTEEHPQIIALVQRMEILEQELLKYSDEGEGTVYERNKEYDRAKQERFEAELERDAYLEERSQKQAQLRQLKEQLSNIPRVEVKAEELQRDIEIKEQLHRNAVQQLRQAEEDWQSLEMRESLGYFSEVSPPRASQTPQLTRVLQVLLAGTFVSLAAGIAVMFGIEFVDQSFVNVDDARGFLRIPSLGVIPTISTSRDRARRKAYWAVAVAGMLGAFIVAGVAYWRSGTVQLLVDSLLSHFGNLFTKF